MIKSQNKHETHICKDSLEYKTAVFYMLQEIKDKLENTSQESEVTRRVIAAWKKKGIELQGNCYN